MEYEIIFPKIHVYKGLIPEYENIVKKLKESEDNPESSVVFKDWQPWGKFGTYVFQLNYYPEKEDIQSLDEETQKEYSYVKMVYDAFYNSTKNFLDYYKLDLPEDWKIMGPSFSRYDKNEDIKQELAMSRHTDYEPWQKDVPGYKFALTCTMYLNDDYEGGEISFKIKDKIIDYKPKAGDIIVFPSGHPEFLCEDEIYLHGVKKISNNDRYLIRCFYQFYHPGSKEWIEGKEKYGEKVWEEMEKERIEREMENVLKK